jgi:hypothetical protein
VTIATRPLAGHPLGTSAGSSSSRQVGPGFIPQLSGDRHNAPAIRARIEFISFGGRVRGYESVVPASMIAKIVAVQFLV